MRYITAILALLVAMTMYSCNQHSDDAAGGDDDAMEATETAKSDVPEAVTSAFNVAYPDATDVEWEQEDDKYEASFTNAEMKMSALYNADGSFVSSEKKIAVDELPEAVHTVAAGIGPITEACIIKLADGSTQYEAEVNDLDYIFDAEGNMLNDANGDKHEDHEGEHEDHE